MKRAERFNVVRLREAIRFGQRVERFAVDVLRDAVWRRVGDGTSIGPCRLLLGEPVTAQPVRLRIEQSAAPPMLEEFGLFAEPGDL